MYFEPVGLLVMFVGIIIIIVPQMYVNSTYKKYLNKTASCGITGAQVAQEILKYGGMHMGATVGTTDGNVGHVRVEAIGGSLSDHYDPRDKVIRLSQDNYYGTSISSIAVAAHEAGHALQDAESYAPLKLRSAFFPAASIGDKLGGILLFLGIILVFWIQIPGLGQLVALAGICLYLAAVLFQFITLPVEFDASSRALSLLRETNLLPDEEVIDAKKVLTAAALTYVAAALYALIQLLYYIWLFFGRRD